MVELANMNRLFFRPEQCGMTKTAAAAETLSKWTLATLCCNTMCSDPIRGHCLVKAFMLVQPVVGVATHLIAAPGQLERHCWGDEALSQISRELGLVLEYSSFLKMTYCEGH
jgi:hypothetical protein